MKKPWFRFFVNDWLTDENVLCLSLEQRGMYIDLLCFQWKEGSIPSNEAIICQLLGLSPGYDSEKLDQVLARFEAHPKNPSRLVNKRLEIERKESEEFSKSKSNAGKRGAKKRWLSHSSVIDEPMAKHSQSQSQSQSHKELLSPTAPVFDFEALYTEYPRKEGKKQGLTKLAKIIASQEDFNRFLLAVRNYTKGKQGVETQYLLNFGTFCNGRWEDWVNPPTQQNRSNAPIDNRPRLKSVTELRAERGE